ncbi:hypothetical protein HD806DRAFT_485980 [Xylariaceae sp. AK1471]|nr:hypothetical protein HD806DRAFT_485980 [Xylariaceae sp. AK1471]
MPQTVYRSPWPAWLPIAISIPLSVGWFIIAAMQGATSYTAVFIGITILVVLLTFTVLDPECTVTSRKTLPDGTAVRVRRPIVGFKRYESQLGLTGGYEVRFDGFRYEPAYIRI